MKKQLISLVLLGVLASMVWAVPNEEGHDRDAVSTYNRTEDTTVKEAPLATAETATVIQRHQTQVSDAMTALNASFDTRWQALTQQAEAARDNDALQTVEDQLHQLRQQHTIDQRRLMLQEALAAGNTERAAQLQIAVNSLEAPVTTHRDTERTLTHEEKLKASCSLEVTR